MEKDDKKLNFDINNHNYEPPRILEKKKITAELITPPGGSPELPEEPEAPQP